jgi:4-amino-4-deoxy-L-arabinose transferase-like glycosyltransferase
LPTTSTDRLAAAALPIFAVVATISIFLHGPLPLFSTRTLSVAWEMWHAGSWLLPLQNGEAYSHKAPLLYWLIHLGWAVGGVGETWPKLLMVLIALANLVLVGVLGRQLFPERPIVGRVAPWIIAGSMFWFLYALQVMFDLLLGACVLACLIGLTRRAPDGYFRADGRWIVLGIWLGLLAKGPVALLHVAFPLLLAPWWLDAARASPARWYRRVAGWVAAALPLFALWVVPVAVLGGDAFRQELLVTQTAGRMVSAFDHAQPPWWYLTVLPLLLFPWVAWPGAWRAVTVRGTLAEPGIRFLLAWMLPTLVAFSLVSGKQIYYLMALVAGFALWLAAVTSVRVDRGPARSGLRIAALPLVALGLLVAALPALVAGGRIRSEAVAAFATAGPWFGLAVAAIGAGLLAGSRDAIAAIPRLGLGSLVAVAILHLQFTLALWPRYDLGPVARVLAGYEAEGRVLANRGTYEGQFHFLGRLTRPIVETDYHAGPAFAEAHPRAIIVDYVKAHDCLHPMGPRPIYCQRFRGERIELWLASDWLLAGQAAGPPPSP